MENRKYDLDFDELYASERRARAERAKEMWRLLKVLGRKLVPNVSPSAKGVPNA